MRRIRALAIFGGTCVVLALISSGCGQQSRTAPLSSVLLAQDTPGAKTQPNAAPVNFMPPPQMVLGPVNPWEKLAVRRVAVKDPVAAKIVMAARWQQGDHYDQSYQSIGYPNGDVPKGQGACTDVVVRALRGANIDLQQLVHEDMQRDFDAYGDKWGLGHTDKNIDHRRVPNLMTFFARHGQSLTLSTAKADLKSWQPGDIICWKLPGNVNHIGIVSSGIGARGLPLVIHNANRCIEQDYLDEWPVTGHYRYPK